MTTDQLPSLTDRPTPGTKWYIAGHPGKYTARMGIRPERMSFASDDTYDSWVYLNYPADMGKLSPVVRVGDRVAYLHPLKGNTERSERQPHFGEVCEVAALLPETARDAIRLRRAASTAGWSCPSSVVRLVDQRTPLGVPGATPATPAERFPVGAAFVEPGNGEVWYVTVQAEQGKADAYTCQQADERRTMYPTHYQLTNNYTRAADKDRQPAPPAPVAEEALPVYEVGNAFTDDKGSVWYVHLLRPFGVANTYEIGSNPNVEHTQRLRSVSGDDLRTLYTRDDDEDYDPTIPKPVEAPTLVEAPPVQVDPVLAAAKADIAAGKGAKADSGKPRPELLPPRALLALASVLAKGAVKYGDNNWHKVPGRRRRYTGAALRHMLAYMAGEVYDAETGEHHLACAMASLAFILEGELADIPEVPENI